MDEFAFIRDHLAPLSGEGAHGLRDDAARLPGGWVISTDTSIEGVHFPTSVRGAAASERAVRVAASDLASKAAEPFGYFANLSLPRDMEDKWVVAVAQGLGDAQSAIGMTLLGGDTTRHDGKLSITITVVGREEVPLLRSGAKVGDDVWLSGPVGGGLLGLRYLSGDMPLSDPTGTDMFYMEEAFLRPEPRFDLVTTLRDHATASIDVSDGLVADMGHIARASGVGIVLDMSAVPMSHTVQSWATDEGRLKTVMSWGDDYEIAFTGKPESASSLREAGCIHIGSVRQGQGVRVCRDDGSEVVFDRPGYSHR